jgi:hypothetical protein
MATRIVSGLDKDKCRDAGGGDDGEHEESPFGMHRRTALLVQHARIIRVPLDSALTQLWTRA